MKKVYFECVAQNIKNVESLKKQYPKLSGYFSNTNILKYLDMDLKMFEPYRPKLLSEKMYKNLHEKLKNFSTSKFILWLTT
jgi:hypothetical protein